MFPNFNSLSQRQNKKQSLFDKAERNIRIENAKKAAYQGAIWASDIEKNKISLVKSTTTANTQTEGTDTQTDTQTDGRADPTNEPRDRAPTFATDIGNEDDTVSEFDDVEDPQSEPIDEENVFDNEEVLQQEAYQAIKEIIDRYPEVATWGINPIKRESSGRPPECVSNVVLGKNAELRNRGNGRRSTMDPDTIDWLLTGDYLADRFNAIKGFESRRETNEARRAAERATVGTNDLRNAFDNLKIATLESKINRAEQGLMSQEDIDVPFMNPNKRRPKSQLQGPPIKMSRFEGVSNFSGDVAQDEATARNNLLEFYLENKEELDRMVVRVIDKEGNLKSRFKVVLNRNRTGLIIVKATSNRLDNNELTERNTSWVYTVIDLKERWEQVQLGRRPRPYTPATTEEERAARTGISAQADSVLDKNYSKEKAQSLITLIHKKLPWIDTLEIRPVYNYKNGPRESDSYMFGDGMELLSIKQGNKPTGKTRTDLINGINWQMTLNHIIREVDTYNELLGNVMNDGPDDASAERGVNRSSTKRDSPEEFNMMKDMRKNINNLFNSLGIEVKDESNRSNPLGFAGRGVELKALAFEPERSATPRVLRVKSKIRLIGRGLVGAGRVRFADDVESVAKPAKRAKNLREVEGSGTASDLKYKRLGSKFIRVDDLKQNKLKVVYANRTPLTPLREISPDLAELINKLVFENDIDQRLYGDLSLEDKRLFTELLKATHLQHHFTNSPSDPIEALKAEFDKLRGQVLLGNNNPDLIRELKSVAVDLYSQKLISENEFKSIVLI